MADDTQLKVFSLNCWGLKYVAKNRLERIAAIAAYLSQSSYDIIALQEIWVFADYEQVRDSVASKLPHAKFFYSGALGSGLAILSRFPIVSASVFPYSLNGAPMDVAAGDWFVGKAAASVVIQHPLLNQVQIFNTHLFAKGGDAEAHRFVNAWEIAKLIQQAAELGRYVIAPGDYNSIPTTLPMTIIKDYASVSDAWSVTHPNNLSITPPAQHLAHPHPNAPASPNTDANPAPPSPALLAILKYGITADSPLNTYSSGKPLDSHAIQFAGKRLDYILYRQPTPHSRAHIPDGARYKIECTHCRVALTETVPEYDFSYSDHFGLEATFNIVPNDPEGFPEGASTLSRGSVANTIQALTACWRLSAARSRKELTIFGLCILLLVAIAIGTAWLPHPWINSILIVFTVFIAWLGTTMLYEGFLYGNWERNALQNIIEELELHQKGLESVRSSRVSAT
ncbi:hypothetical protein HGRIS_008332 [Hohenbuehelia grisea]|uniref:Endonuclease/exonuclease/phosphatase domain-containing protein n=1 Tax=Hohenbuehelia grisea TaxID=104357 RepID=A0ABR3J7T4_9AGAR